MNKILHQFSSHFGHSIEFGLCCLLIMFFTFSTFGQSTIAEVRAYGGNLNEEANQIIECQDGGYVVVGNTGSDQANNSNIYAIKIDQDLNCIWSKSIGGSNSERGYSVLENENQELLICGVTNSFGYGGYDAVVYKINADGDIIWQKTFGGTDWDFGYKIVKHPGAGYLLCGMRNLPESEVSLGYLVHLNEEGQSINEWTYQSELNEEIVDIDFTDLDEIILTGNRFDDSSEIRFGIVRRLGSDGQELGFQIIGGEDDYTNILNAEIYEGKYYHAGYKMHNSVLNSFVSAIELDGTVLFNDDQVFTQEETYNDIMIANGLVYTAGRSKVVGYGGFDGIVYARSLDGWFQGAFFYGNTSDEAFNSMILNSSGQLVTTGYRTVNQTQKDFLVMKYLSPILTSENIMSPTYMSCFTTDLVELSHNESDFILKQYYTFNGQLVAELKANEVFEIQGGLYITVTTDSQGNKYYSKEFRE